MNIDDFRSLCKERLSGLYESEEVQNLCFLAFEHVMNMNRVEVSLSRKFDIPSHHLHELMEVLNRLENGEPIQYIVGDTEFYGLNFQVNPSTLIPRPETEELVAWVLNSESKTKKSELRILDIGTGSGCIAISLAKNISHAIVEGVDISQNALATAYQNAMANQVEVAFYHQDILETDHLEKQYDVIISNPPYVRELEKDMMRENVLGNEPASALFVSDEDPLIFYRAIGKLAFENLTAGGILFFEINEYLGAETVALLTAIGFRQVTLKKDMFGKDRMIKAIL